MTPEDKELWDQFVAGITRLIPKPFAPSQPPRGRIPVHNVQFVPFLDLHGHTVEGAFEATKRHVYEARVHGFRFVTIVTGKSGTICYEFPAWVELIPAISRIEPLNGGGAFKVYLKRR